MVDGLHGWGQTGEKATLCHAAGAVLGRSGLNADAATEVESCRLTVRRSLRGCTSVEGGKWVASLDPGMERRCAVPDCWSPSSERQPECAGSGLPPATAECSDSAGSRSHAAVEASPLYQPSSADVAMLSG